MGHKKDENLKIDLRIWLTLIFSLALIWFVILNYPGL